MDDSKVIGGKVKKPGKCGRKPAKIDLKAKLERSRQSARQCRARKNLQYQFLEELVSSQERAICGLREELEMYKQWCMAMNQGKIPSEIKAFLTGEEQSKSQQNLSRHTKSVKTEANIITLGEAAYSGSAIVLGAKIVRFVVTEKGAEKHTMFAVGSQREFVPIGDVFILHVHHPSRRSQYLTGLQHSLATDGISSLTEVCSSEGDSELVEPTLDLEGFVPVAASDSIRQVGE
ncbi:cAMP-responsive element-binding protein-like 2 [Monodelphis domestica]|uniref:cAMP-responsive element-binding protein-like 2 n=1 Tax=Monodelphis domestica TaxID=13616 RepID=UPI0024E1B738|nr:cAMP-responsive element-binding protein-like 2 [Monodelphis domestica]